MEVSEGLGHFDPKPRNILCREQAFGRNDAVRANAKPRLLTIGHAA